MLAVFLVKNFYTMPIQKNIKSQKWKSRTTPKSQKSTNENQELFLNLSNRWDRLACWSVDFFLTFTILWWIINIILGAISNITLWYKIFWLKLIQNNGTKKIWWIRFLIYFPNIFFLYWIFIMFTYDNSVFLEMISYIFWIILSILFIVNLIEFFQKWPTFIDDLIWIKRYSPLKKQNNKKNLINETVCPICQRDKEKLDPLCNICTNDFFELTINAITKNPNFDINDIVDIQNDIISNNWKAINYCITCHTNKVNDWEFLCRECLNNFMITYIKLSDLNKKYEKTHQEIFKNALLLTKWKADFMNLINTEFHKF